MLRSVILAAAVLAAACSNPEPSSTAFQIESLDQAIGGPAAGARVGDFILRNDVVQFAIEGGRTSRQPLDVGGSIIDADLVRPDARYRGGNGLDALGQINPTANMYQGKATLPATVRVTRTATGAEVTSASRGVAVFKLLTALGILIQRDFLGVDEDYLAQRIYNEYELRPGEKVLRITTTVGYDVDFCAPEAADGCNAECDDILYDDDCVCPGGVPARCLQGVRTITADALPDRPVSSFLDLLMGDLPRPIGTGRCHVDTDCTGAETCQPVTTTFGGDFSVCRAPDSRDAGVLLGDMLILGNKLNIYLPDTAFDAESDFRRLFDKGYDTLAYPMELDEVFGITHDVSYGFAPPVGKIFIPVFGGSFSVGATASASCRHDERGCLSKTLVRYQRLLSIGEGDPASAREPLDLARGVALGTVTGNVLWDKTSEAVSNAEVYAFRDPRDLTCDAACQARCPFTDADVATLDAAKLIAANKCRTPGGRYLEGHAAIENMAKTDPGTDPIHDGAYRMTLPPGRYLLVAKYESEAMSTPAPVTVAANAKAAASFRLPLPGRIEYQMYDDDGQYTAGRLVIGKCFPTTPCQVDADCASGESCYEAMCRCDVQPLVPLELGGTYFVDGTIAFEQTKTGRGEISLPAGTYEIAFSHGPLSTIDKQTVTLESGTATNVQGEVRHAVDEQDWISTDFHNHASPSPDSGTSLQDRVTSFLAEDLDFLTSSDHDVITRYWPVISEMGVSKQLGSMVGVETTTQEIGHFIAFPLVYNEWHDGQRLDGNGAPDWRELKPAEIIEAMRAMGDPNHPMVIDIPHPYSYFDYYRLDPKTMEPTDSLLTLLNDLVNPVNFSGEFDAMELMNGKSVDQIRRPTIGELRFFSQAFDALLARSAAGEIDEAQYRREYYNLGTEFWRRALHRTVKEQEAALAGKGAENVCRCASDGDCAAGAKCDLVSMTCYRPTADGSVDLHPRPPSHAKPIPPPDEYLCRSLRGVVDDWFAMLNHGIRRIGLSGADVHGLYGAEAGAPRSMLLTGGTTPPNLDHHKVVEAVLAGKVLVTNGPMVRFQVNGADLGSTVTGHDVTMTINVQRAPWYDVDRIEVYRNGELIHWISGCTNRRSGDGPEGHDHPCIETGEGSDPVYDITLTDTPDKDAWYVVTVMGLDGRTLAPVYSSGTLLSIGTFEITQRVYDLIPLLTEFRTPRYKTLYPAFPYAITNPIYVDLDGDGWQPPITEQLSWCSKDKGDIGCP